MTVMTPGEANYARHYEAEREAFEGIGDSVELLDSDLVQLGGRAAAMLDNDMLAQCRFAAAIAACQRVIAEHHARQVKA